MIVADRKPMEEIIEQVKGLRSVLVLGCNECVTVCEAGGKKEVGVLASALRMYFLQQGREVNIGERTLERQCDTEYLEEIRDSIDHYEAVVSLACGVGIQFTAERYPSKAVYPGVNTCCMGAALEPGVWAERCQGCGNCILATTGAVCPVARCANIGGVLATISYTIAFLGAAAGMFLFSLLLIFFARETLPQRVVDPQAARARWGGYGRVLRDQPFMRFIAIFTLTQMCATLIWVLMGVYMKQNYDVVETQWGLIATTNALMVVFFQLPVTQATKRYPPLAMLAVGSLFYACGVGSVALGGNFSGFWLSMVVLTVGELILLPTSIPCD